MREYGGEANDFHLGKGHLFTMCEPASLTAYKILFYCDPI